VRQGEGRGGSRSFSLIGLSGASLSRNVLDSCVKSLQYFHTDNVSLKTSLHWLSGDLVRFKIEVGFARNLQKCNTISDVVALSPQILAVTRCEVINYNVATITTSVVGTNIAIYIIIESCLSVCYLSPPQPLDIRW